MGYTSGRKHTTESLQLEAKKYQSRSEFIAKDPSAYTIARVRGILDGICSHMLPLTFSIPQRVCQQIFNALLNSKAQYNTRKIISPFELDLYYPAFKLGVEYCGKGWHNTEEAKERDFKKKILCQGMDIFLIVLAENSRSYEQDIKQQIATNLPSINTRCGLALTAADVMSVRIDYQSVYLVVNKLEQIKEKIKHCVSIGDFQKKYSHDYRILKETKNLDLLERLRLSGNHRGASDDMLLEKCKAIQKYADFVKDSHGLYLVCRKRGILKEATSHMKRGRPANFTKEDIQALASGFKRRGDFQNTHSGAYNAARRMNIIDEIFPPTDFWRIRYGKKGSSQNQ